MAGLLRAIETDAEPDISGRDHLDTLALSEAVLASSREHRIVSLKESRGRRTLG
jgi:predicted dehydrogenase